MKGEYVFQDDVVGSGRSALIDMFVVIPFITV